MKILIILQLTILAIATAGRHSYKTKTTSLLQPIQRQSSVYSGLRTVPSKNVGIDGISVHSSSYSVSSPNGVPKTFGYTSHSLQTADGRIITTYQTKPGSRPITKVYKLPKGLGVGSTGITNIQTYSDPTFNGIAVASAGSFGVR
ncbi:uncharacterized protein LOC119670962 [Teleopsis dalmanni]|uniref:uncharacterized protein LOC119670962 n=1 Tax=Teleopsis dalmanni TaxID=139649 RepID=UPI0018CE1552|nr:uncharacterized protein LOC119670962 [Teleopsis dalmanni]